VNSASPLPDSSAGAVNIRDIPLRLAYNAWEQAETESQKLFFYIPEAGLRSHV